MKTMKAQSVLAAALLLVVAGVAPAQEICPEFVEMTEGAMPEQVGDREFLGRMLRVEAEGMLSKSFDPGRVQEVLRDVLRPADPCRDCRQAGAEHEQALPEYGQKIYRGGDGSLMRVNLSRGKIAYLNPRRGHDAVAGKEARIELERAAEYSLELAQTFGVPVAELDRKLLEARELYVAAGSVEGEIEVNLRAEVHVRVPRRIGGVPVFDSYLLTAIGADDLVARMHLKWPDFQVVPGLAVKHMVDRDRVMRSILETLADSNPCGSLSRVVVELAWVEAGELAVSATQADDGDRRPTGAERAFVPALVVYATPVEPEEDSGKIAAGGQQFVVPLVAAELDAAGGRG